MKKRHFLWLTLIVLLLVLFGVTVYAQVADNTMTINASPISPYHIATGLPYRISSMFDFSSVPDGYHLSNVEFDFDTNPEAADFIRIEKVGSYNSTEFYLICTEDSLHGTAPLYLNFTFTNGTDTLNESGTVYLTFDGSSFLGTTFSSQGTSDDTALMFSDGMSIYMYPTVSDTAPLTLYFNDNIENCLTQNGFNYSDSYEYYLMLKAESDPQNPIPSDKGVKKSNESVSAYGFQFPEDSGVFREILQRDYTIWLEVLEKEEGLTTQTILMPTGFTIKKLFNVKSIDHDKLIAGRKHDSFQYESGIPEFNLNVEWDRETINETENKLVLTTDGKVIPIVHSLEHPLTLEGKYKPQKNGSDLNLAEELVTFSVSIGSIESPVKALNDSVTIPMDEFTKIFTLDLPKKGDRDYAGYELDDISVKLNGEDAKDAFEITVENGGVFLKPLRALYQAQFQFTFTITNDEEGYPDIVDEIPVTVTAFGNPVLSGLTINEGTLSPAFAEDTYSYTASVGNSTNSLNVTPTAQDATANITVNGAEVKSGNASSAIPLSVGNNTINIVVTTQNGNTKTYSIVVTRAEAENPYISRKLTDTGTGITVSGSIHSGSAIVVEDMVLHPEGSCTACDTIRNTQDENQLILGCNISLTMGFSGPLTVSLPVGSQYNGKAVTILHCMDGSLETITVTVSDGMATFTVTSLSPFAVFDLAEETDPDNLPVVVTNTITDIKASSATFNGTVSNTVAYEVTECGFLYKTSSSDGDEIKVVAQGNGAGSFSAAVNGLEPNTTYYVRAYVKNAAGTFYGETVSFRTAEANLASSPLTGDKRTSSSLMVLAVGAAAGIAVLIWRRRRVA